MPSRVRSAERNPRMPSARRGSGRIAGGTGRGGRPIRPARTARRGPRTPRACGLRPARRPSHRRSAPPCSVDEPSPQRALAFGSPTISTATFRFQRLCRRWWTMRPPSHMPGPGHDHAHVPSLLLSAIDSAAVSANLNPLSSWRKAHGASSPPPPRRTALDAWCRAWLRRWPSGYRGRQGIREAARRVPPR